MVNEEYSDTLQKLELEQKSKAWLEARNKYITASDASAIMMFKKGENYYSKTPEMWFEGKMGNDTKHSPYQLKVMKMGELSEESIVLTHFKSPEYTHGDVYTRECFLASLDVLKADKTLVVELKHTVNAGAFAKYKSYDHPAFYQLAFQMILMGIGKGCVVVNFQPEFGESHLEAFNITTESKHYREMQNNWHYLKEVHKSVVIDKVNPFVKKCSNEFQLLVNAIEERKKQISDLKEEIEIYEEKFTSLLSEGKFISAIVDGESYKFTLKPSVRTKKILKIGYKETDVFDFEKTEVLRVSRTKEKS